MQFVKLINQTLLEILTQLQYTIVTMHKLFCHCFPLLGKPAVVCETNVSGFIWIAVLTSIPRVHSTTGRRFIVDRIHKSPRSTCKYKQDCCGASIHSANCYTVTVWHDGSMVSEEIERKLLVLYNYGVISHQWSDMHACVIVKKCI